ncbi:MAG: hypothetical protein L0Y54_24295, partial [Sporichthyaceae bacterium]|nr:hypothetical protein [Sporichthyaceae bacterium]
LRDHGVGRILHQRDATPAGLLALVDEMVADRARYVRRYADWAAADSAGSATGIDPIARVTALLESYAP